MSDSHWYLLYAIWAFAVGMTAVGTVLALRHLSRASRPRTRRSTSDAMGVTILKPLRGLDEGISENLESFFRLDYPKYEILFTVASADDPVCEVVRKHMIRYPGVKARLILGAVEAGLNPKVNNLIRSYEQAAYDSIVISDSNCRVTGDYLERLVSHFAEDVGMMTSIVAGFSPRGLGGLLEATFLNTFFARALTVASAIGQPCVMGKSMMFRRSVLDQVGGIRGLGEYLAEDYQAGEKIRQLGLRVLVLSEPIHQFIGNYSFGAFWSRHVRWGRLRKVQAPFLFLMELWVGCLVSGVLGALAFSHFYGVEAPLFLALHLAFWGTCDLLLMRKMGQSLSLKSAGAWLVRECSHFLLWAHIAAGNSVEWRGQTITLCYGGTIRRKNAAESALHLVEPLPSVITLDGVRQLVDGLPHDAEDEAEATTSAA